jgi:hypothetical protein
MADFPRPQLVGDQALEHSPEEIHVLETHGLLRQMPNATTVDCLECGEFEPVFYREIGGVPKIFSSCRRGGLQMIDRQRLRRWEISLVGLMDWLHESLQLAGTRVELASGRIWRLGRLRNGDRQGVMFVWGLHRYDVVPLLSSHHWTGKTLLFVPAKVPLDVRLPMSVGVIPLAEVVQAQGERLVIESALDQLAAGAKPITKAPLPPKRSRRTAMIEALTRCLLEHVRAAREHLLFLEDSGQELTALPRPTRRDLAKQLGTEEWNVGRCLNDPTANELRYLWELADDSERLRDYSLAVR